MTNDVIPIRKKCEIHNFRVFWKVHFVSFKMIYSKGKGCNWVIYSDFFGQSTQNSPKLSGLKGLRSPALPSTLCRWASSASLAVSLMVLQERRYPPSTTSGVIPSLKRSAGVFSWNPQEKAAKGSSMSQLHFWATSIQWRPFAPLSWLLGLGKLQVKNISFSQLTIGNKNLRYTNLFFVLYYSE